jgi:hypothetical protein
VNRAGCLAFCRIRRGAWYVRPVATASSRVVRAETSGVRQLYCTASVVRYDAVVPEHVLRSDGASTRVEPRG